MGRKNYSDGSQNSAWEYLLGAGNVGATLALGVSKVLDCQDVFSIASVQLSFPSAPATASVNLEGSMDGVNWTVLATTTTVSTTPFPVNSVGLQFRLLRVNVTAFSGGASPTVIAIVAAQTGASIGGSSDIQTVLAATGSTSPVTTLNAQTAIANGTTVDFGHAVQEIAFSITGSAGITAGAVTIQVSADGANWVAPPTAAFMNNSAATLANPYTVPASSVALFTLEFAAVRYARVNISTTVTGGTVSATISGA